LVEEYDGPQYVGIDLHKRRSVIVRMTPEGERIGRPVRIDSDPFELAGQIASWGEDPEVVLEATYGWYWAADVLTDAGVSLHMAHPLVRPTSQGVAHVRVDGLPGPALVVSEVSMTWVKHRPGRSHVHEVDVCEIGD
jgi:hypothetical protein